MQQLDRYLTTKPDYLADFEDAEFSVLYHQHQAKFYLRNITEGMLKDLGLNYAEGTDAFKHFQSWVYMFGTTIRKREEAKEQIASDALKSQIKQLVGKRLNLSIKGSNSLGIDCTKSTMFRVGADEAGRVFLIPPKARKRGYWLDNVTVLEVGK